MDRLKLTSPDSRSRIKDFLNERYRAVATSCGLSSVRFGTVSQATVAGTVSYAVAGLVHPITVTYPAGNRVLIEKTQDFIRNLDPDASVEGAPQYFVISRHNATTVTLSIWPKPDDAYDLTIDGIVTGTDMSADGDIPALPEDFHDTLVFGATADELMKLEKAGLAQGMEGKFKDRLGELRYFCSVRSYLTIKQGEDGQWWWGFWWGTYRG
jgi:hypothetical protein